MQVRLTRRELGVSIVAARPALAVAQAEASPEQLLAAERKDLESAVEKLDRFRLPMATEPSFRFEP